MDVQSSRTGPSVIPADFRPLRVAFRTDASVHIGTGHVMRCLTLANALREQGAECLFICRPHAGHLLDWITQQGHQVAALPRLVTSTILKETDLAHAHWLGTDWEADAADTRQALGDVVVDWLVVDHYALDVRWEQVLRVACRRLMVIDDLADRIHDCDLLLDQNLGRIADDYSGLIANGVPTLIGPRYALLRPEFAQLRAESLARRAAPQLKHLLVTMGGVDKDNATGCVLDALNACTLPNDVHITVVMGPHAPWLHHVQAQASQMRFSTQVLVGVGNMARLMTNSDFAIGAAGGTAWERCCLGLPSLVLLLAENQRMSAAALRTFGAGLVADSVDEVQRLIQKSLGDAVISVLFQRLGSAAQKITDGLGAKVVAQVLCEHYG